MRTPQPLPQPLVGVPFTVGHARRYGVDELRLRAADIHHPFHGVNLASAPGELRELCRAYLLVMPAESYFSHTTAAALMGVPLPMDAYSHPLHVSVRSPRTAPRGKRVIGHSLRTLVGAVIDGLPISAPAHVWCQLSGMIGAEDLVAAGDHLVGARARPARVTADELSALSVDVHRTRGSRARAWALPRIRFGADSRPETLLRVLLEELGAGEVAVNQPLVVDGGAVTLHPDLALPAQRIAVEYEGDGHRVDRRQWVQDIRRHELLEAAGWRVVRVTADDLFRDPDALIARLRRFVPNLGKAAPKTAIWHKS